MSPLEPRALRDAFGTFLTGVTVVTTLDAAGNPIGFTANSFSSVSLDPPLLLVCVARSSANLGVFLSARGFAVNVLSEKQKDVSNTFARPVEDRFAAVSWRPGPYGSPVFDEVSAWFDCAPEKTVEAGDHVVLIARVKAFETGVDNGLGYARGSYFTLGLEREAAAAVESEAGGVVSAVIERDGQVLLVDDGQGVITLPHARLEGARGAMSRLAELIGEIGLDISVGFIFSVYEDRSSGVEHVVYHCAAGDGTPGVGAFMNLAELPFDRISDKATASLLRRFREESRMGQFGVYFGDENSGEIRRLSAED